MKLIQSHKRILGFLVAVLSLSGFVSSSVGAEATTNSAQGLELSPTLVELNAVRGGTYNVKIKLRNVTASNLVYSVSANDFNSADETGSPHIILDSKLPATASVVEWIANIPQFSLASQVSKEINAQITIPNNAEPGGHYGVLRFSGSTPEISSTGVGLSASAGVLLLIRVDGNITEKANLASFYSANGNNQSFFFESGPINFVTRINNSGNIHLKPTGTVTLHDMFGGTVSTMSVNSDKANILPNSIRKFESQYDGPWMIGRYTADLTLGYGTKGQALTSTISFWVIPYRLILVSLFALVTIIFVLSKFIKVYNRHIIEKSKNEHKTKNHKITKEKRSKK